MGDKKEGIGGGGKVFAQAGLEGGPEMFDGIEVRGIGRQKQELAASLFDQLLRGRRLMKPGIVQDDHTARRQHGQQHLGKINVHHLGVATALKDQRRDQLAPLGNGNDAGAFPPSAANLAGIRTFHALRMGTIRAEKRLVGRRTRAINRTRRTERKMRLGEM